MRVVAYCRYSTENQTLDSIEYQMDAIKDYCFKHSLSLTDSYVDKARSGINIERSSLHQLIEDIQDHKFEGVVIYDQSRLSRNIQDWFSLRNILKENNIQLFSCIEPIEDYEQKASAFLPEGIRAVFNHNMVLETREKIMNSKTNKAKNNGTFMGGYSPLGYDIIDGKYVINEDEAKAIRLIFSLYAQGCGYSTIINELKRNEFKSKKGTDISNDAIFSIIHNDKYIGRYSWNKHKNRYLHKWVGGKDNPHPIIIEGHIPAIIDDDLWNVVQKRISNNQREYSSNGKENNFYLLSGLIKCSMCGGTYIGVTNKSKKGTPIRYYICNNKRRLHTWTNENINADSIEDMVRTKVKEKFLNPQFINGLYDSFIQIIEENELSKSKIDVQIKDCELAIQNLHNAIKITKSEQVVSGIIKEIENEQARIVRLNQELNSKNGIYLDRNKIIDALKRDLDDIDNDSVKAKIIINKYIKKINVSNTDVTIILIEDIVNPNT